MLLQYSCENFRSIRDEITFSMRKARGETLPNRVLRFNGIDIESVSAIYGANGSGKSNFISSIEFMKYMVETSVKFQPGHIIRISPHKLSDESETSSFRIQFTLDGIRYAYGFSVLGNAISEEYLYYFPKTRQVKVFDRQGLNVTFGSQYRRSFGLSMEALRENCLFLSCAANYPRVEAIRKALGFFSEGLAIYRGRVDGARISDWHEYAVELMRRKPEVKAKFLSILNSLGVGILDLRFERRAFGVEEIAERALSPFKELSLTAEAQSNGLHEIKIAYPEFETDLLTEEGAGTQRLFQLVCLLLDALENGKVIFYDAIETGLHELVVRRLIELFYYLKPESEAQLIFTTHDIGLLSQRLLTNSQIWFTELKSGRNTDLYSLAEVRKVSQEENRERGYIHGKYGAVPKISRQNFILRT